VICKSCGSELVSESDTCLFCNSKSEISPLPAEDSELPSTPWHQPRPAGDLSLFADEPWSELRTKIIIDESHKERTWSEDFNPFKQYLRRRGRLIVEKKGRFQGAKLEGVKMVVVGGPEKSWLIDRKADRWQDDEIAYMKQYVESGGCLLVMGDRLSDARRLSALTSPFGISFSRETVGDVTVYQADMARHPILDSVSAFRLGDFHGSGGFFLDVIEPAFELAWVEGHPVLAACYFGRGMIVAISNLMVFSEKQLSQLDNGVFLEKLIDEVMRENKTKKARPLGRFQGKRPDVVVSLEPMEDNTYEDIELVYPEETAVAIEEVHDRDDLNGDVDAYLDLEEENEEVVEPEETGVGFEACESLWRAPLDELIAVWQVWEEAYDLFTAEYEPVEDAEYPQDRELLIDVWQRDIEYWQPKFIELMDRELSLWGDLYANDEIDKVSRCLLHDLMVNRQTAIVQREQRSEILKNQLAAMENEDQYVVEELFDNIMDVSYASALLRNDYVDLLQNLSERGLPIPEEHIPEREDMEKEDWERGWSIIEWMQPIIVPENGKVRVAVSGETVDEFDPMLDAQSSEEDKGDDLPDQTGLDLKAA
jgi:hypothetical protein